jgi:hypothetical protein
MHTERNNFILHPDVIIFFEDLVTFMHKVNNSILSHYGKMVYMNVILQVRVGKKNKLLPKAHPNKMFFNITSKVASRHSHVYPPSDSFNFAYTSYKYPTSRVYSNLHT